MDPMHVTSCVDMLRNDDFQFGHRLHSEIDAARATVFMDYLDTRCIGYTHTGLRGSLAKVSIFHIHPVVRGPAIDTIEVSTICLLYTSDAADE